MSRNLHPGTKHCLPLADAMLYSGRLHPQTSVKFVCIFYRQQTAKQAAEAESEWFGGGCTPATSLYLCVLDKLNLSVAEFLPPTTSTSSPVQKKPSTSVVLRGRNWGSGTQTRADCGWVDGEYRRRSCTSLIYLQILHP